MISIPRVYIFLSIHSLFLMMRDVCCCRCCYFMVIVCDWFVACDTDVCSIFFPPLISITNCGFLVRIKILQSHLAKPVTLKTHTKLMPVPVTSKPFSYKQIIQTVKQSRPTRVSKAIVQVQQRPPASPTAPASLFDPFKSLAPLHTPLQAHHTKWIKAPICRYNKQLQTAI